MLYRSHRPHEHTSVSGERATATRHYVDRLSFGERWYGWYGGVVVHSIRLCLIGSNVIASEGENDGLVFWELALTTDLR